MQHTILLCVLSLLLMVAGAHSCRALDRVSGCCSICQSAGCTAARRRHTTSTGVMGLLAVVGRLHASPLNTLTLTTLCQGFVVAAQVSDQDYLTMNSGTPDRIDLCERMVGEGRAEDVAFRYEPC